MNPITYCYWSIGNENLANIDENIHNTFNEQGYQNSHVYTIEKTTDRSNQEYDKYMILQEYKARQLELKTLTAQSIPPELTEKQVTYPCDLTIQEEIELLREKRRTNLINTIQYIGLNIDQYNNMSVQTRIYILNLAEIQKRLILNNDPIEMTNMLPSERLYNELYEMINHYPSLIKTIKTNNWTTPEMIAMLKEVRILAKQGNLVCQHFTAIIFAEGTKYLDAQKNLGDDLDVYYYILQDFKNKK